MLVSEMYKALRENKSKNLTDASIEQFVKTYHDTICSIYSLDRFDNVFIGPEKHSLCIQWIFDNQELFLRYHNVLQLPRIAEYITISKEINRLRLRLLTL